MTTQAYPPAGASADITDWRPRTTPSGPPPASASPTATCGSRSRLLCGFAVWGMWGIITVQMLNLGFPFTQAELFTLTAIAGISGATMRIPASFLIRWPAGATPSS
jgi:NNP family nitrate/nitrite transporter-like MFS transporter